jgi:hypothetical protein
MMEVQTDEPAFQTSKLKIRLHCARVNKLVAALANLWPPLQPVRHGFPDGAFLTE